MNKPLISVILPVYNVKEYLDNCIRSVVIQTYDKLEIILVNDGSTDGSEEMCKKWEKKDSRIKVIDKVNEGLGFARNTGLDAANGKYVMFIDSDDFIKKDTVEKLLAGIKDEDTDTVFCGHIIYYGDEKTVDCPIKYADKSFEGEDVINIVLMEMMGGRHSDKNDIVLPMSVWHGLYSMELIKKNKVRFPSEREFISEDMIFDIDYFRISKKVVFIDGCYYYYRKNNASSLTTKYNPERFRKEVILYKKAEIKLAEFVERKLYIERLQRTFLGRVRSCIIRAERQSNNPEKEINEICKDRVVQGVLKEYPYMSGGIKIGIFNFCLKRKSVLGLRVLAKLRNHS